MSKKMNGADYMSRFIHESGTTHVFFMEAVLRHTMKGFDQLGVKNIMTHSEIGAGYMADGYARASGQPGICCAQSIGSANLAAGLGDAWLANSPVIAFTGKKLPMYSYKNSYQEIDHHKMFEGVTKFNGELTEIDQLPFLLRQLYREVTTGKARPAHLDLPGLTAKNMEVAEIDSPMVIQKDFTHYPAYRPSAEPNMVKTAAAAIASALKPLIVAGRGATVSEAGNEILALAKKCDIPVATTPDGKCSIDEHDEHWAGIVGFYGMDCANWTAANADLIIFIGTQTGDQTTNDWRTPTLDKPVIQIDIDGSELGKNYPNSIGLMGDAKVIAAQLVEASAEKKNVDWRNTVKKYMATTLAYYEELISADNNVMKAERLCREVEKALPDDVLLVADTGYAAQWTSTMIRMKPSQRYIRAAGSLGWAYPGSLGAKCGAPERPVVCFIGDTGFYYYLTEMETAVKYGINTVTVLNNNRMQSQSLPNLEANYSENRGVALKKISYPPIDFTTIAKEFGLYAIKVENPDEIRPAIIEALNAGKPALIEVITDGDHVVPDPMGFAK